MTTQSKSNALKSLAGKKLQDFLSGEFDQLLEKGLILGFDKEINFKHIGYDYEKQYLVNFLINTLDNKYIIISCSTSFRNDRFKTQAYDLNGVIQNSAISSDIIASVALYPDKQLEESTFVNFRKKIKEGEAYSPISHLLTLSEFCEFLENLKTEAEVELDENFNDADDVLKDGSYYGRIGNAKEKEVVKILENLDYLSEYKSGRCKDPIFETIVNQFCINHSIHKEEIISISATDTVAKLASGGNAKTDIVVTLTTNTNSYSDTFSIKNSTKPYVSCHDYKYENFVKVLGVSGTRLENYFKLFQQDPSHRDFKKNLPSGYSINEFEDLLTHHRYTLTEWVLRGMHDHDNLIYPDTQIANNILIIKSGNVFCSDYLSYIDKLFDNAKLKYSVPFGWTYPSKQRGKRIQLKMPLLTN